MVTENQMKKIEEFAIDVDWNIAFGGNSKGNMHLFRVVKTAKLLSQSLDVDASLVEAGAWLHDTGLAKGVATSPLSYKEEVTTFLKNIDITEKEINVILHCIEAHDGRFKAESFEAKLVHDADTLDKMGAMGVIRETWKRTSAGWTSDQIAEHLEKHLKKRMENLYTNEAKKLANELNNNLVPFFDELNKIIGGQIK
jgi:HD superfamily phosphodiesterase